VKIVDQQTQRVRYVPNYINFDLTNFNIQEKGSLRDLVNRKIDIQAVIEGAESGEVSL
jgi:hypothetical protein